MNILDLKIKKIKLKEDLNKSIFFSLSNRGLDELNNMINSLPEDEDGLNTINKLTELFKSERDYIEKEFKKALEK